MHLIFLSSPKSKIEDKEVYHWLIDVLRKREGAEVLFTDGKGRKIKACIEKIDRKKKLFTLKGIEVIEKVEPTPPFINLFCAIPKKNRFEWLVEKTTELGADRIFPLICQRQQKLDLNLERIIKISQRATAQSNRLFAPQIFKPLEFEKALFFCKTLEKSVNILFSLDAMSTTLKSLLSQLKDCENINIFIGPEGDFSDSEIKLAKMQGFLLCKLSMNILRTETAGIFLTSILSFCLKT